MSDEFEVPEELTTVEGALRKLSLPPSAINRDQLMFKAGWAAAESNATRSQNPRLRWLWPATSGVLAATAATLALVLISASRWDRESDEPARLQLAGRSDQDIITSRTLIDEDNSLLAMRNRLASDSSERWQPLAVARHEKSKSQRELLMVLLQELDESEPRGETL